MILNNIHKELGFKKYFNNTLWLFSERIIRMIISIVIGVMLTRYLNPIQFGTYSYVQSFVGLFILIANLGLDEILVREIVNDKFHTESLLNTALFLKLIGFLIMLIILTIFIYIFNFDINIKIYIYVIALSILFQSFNVIEFYLQAKIMGKHFSILSLISLLISSCLKIYFIYNKAPLISFFYLITLESLIITVLQIFVLKKKTNIILNPRLFSKKIAIYLLNNSWPLIFTGIVVSLYMKIDQIMIMDLLNSTAVGEYAAAVKISEAWYFIPTIIMTSLFPAILLAKQDNEKYIRRLRLIYKLMIIVSLLISIPMTFLSKNLINFLYGSEYENSGNILMIHIWSSIFVFIGVANSKWFIAENLQKYYIINTTFGAFLNIILNFIFIPKFGIVAAAWATLISYFFAAYFCLFIFNKTRPQFFFITKSLFN